MLTAMPSAMRPVEAPTRRAVVGAALAAPAILGARARAEGARAVPPIVFVHGNGDSGAVWLTTLWRFETNGVERERLRAPSFADPLARGDDGTPQANRSSTEDQRRALAEAVADLRARTGAARVALVGNSRGGYAIRNFVRGAAGEVSHAILCGVPNHGVYAWDDNRGGEFNGLGPFLARLNGRTPEADEGPRWLTLRSDGYDKYAQPDGRFVGSPGRPTGVTSEGPALTGADNLVLGRLDHRETAFHPRAFAAMYAFLAGRAPDRVAVVDEDRVVLDGLVTGLADGVATNRPLADAAVEVFRVDPDTGARRGDAVHRRVTGGDGRWGPVAVGPRDALEFVLAARGHPTSHTYRSPFPRSSDVVHLRPSRPLVGPRSGAVVGMTRPRGYFGLPRDVVLLDGREPADVTPGVPTDSSATLRLPDADARAVAALFNEERIVARAWPAAEDRVAIAEFTT